MSRSLALFAIGLVFGGGAGFLYAASNGVTLDGHDHSDPAQHGEHAGLSVPEGHHNHDAPLALDPADAPSLALELTEDPVSGWNLHVMTDGFGYAPDRAGADHVTGEGHAHVYVNGAKVARLYGPWMHLADLPEGAEVEVTLNANDHRVLTVNGEPVSARVRAGN